MKSTKISILSTSPSSLLPAGAYIYSITTLPRCANAPSLAAIASDDSLRLFDCATLQPLASVQQQHHHHEGVTCLRPWGGAEADADSGGGGGADGSVLTAGRDGRVRGWDFRAGREMVLDMGGDSSHATSSPPLLSLDSRAAYVATGAEFSNAQACVTVWDYRSTKSPLVQYVESHNDDVTELQFHPTDSTRLLSGGMDGLVNIYDTAIVDEDDALIHIINHGSSISHAGFLSDTEIYALSHDESFTVQPLTDPGEESSSSPPDDQSRQVFGDLRPILNCDYIVDIVPTSRPKGVIIGAGSHSHPDNQYLDLVPLRFDKSQWSLASTAPDNKNKKQTMRIPGGHGSEIIRSFCFNHPSQSPAQAQTILYTAGEDGLIRAWAVDEDEDEDEHENEHEDENEDEDPNHADDKPNHNHDPNQHKREEKTKVTMKADKKRKRKRQKSTSTSTGREEEEEMGGKRKWEKNDYMKDTHKKQNKTTNDE